MSQRTLWAITILATLAYTAVLTYTLQIGPRP